MAKRIGILTGGGDCPGLNAVIRAVVLHARGTLGWEVIGIEDGFTGMYEQRYIDLTARSVAGLICRGGTVLGSSNRANPFAYPFKRPGGGEEILDVSDRCVANVERLDLEGLILVGGDGTMSIGQKLMAKGLRVVGVPKTIDNDLEATEYTIGFQTAVEVASEAIDRLHTTAESHDRIIICEVMGRYAGWIAMAAGMASGSDVILIPEIDYDLGKVIGSLNRRHGRGNTYSIIVIAEGAKPKGGAYAVVKSGDVTQQELLGGAGQVLAEEIRKQTEFDVRVTVLGHIQRGGTPCAFDRLLATRFGATAVELVASGRFGQVAALRSGEIVSAPLDLAVAKLKRVDPDGDLVRAARSLGIELG
ncbi:MAG TPA: ATP-dependent 6-phosphofructokinase [Kofleriaceae bacterium]|nr:ATP-dependent 6-phosphofructokinase [Kofleriaceae bacterium]